MDMEPFAASEGASTMPPATAASGGHTASQGHTGITPMLPGQVAGAPRGSCS